MSFIGSFLKQCVKEAGGKFSSTRARIDDNLPGSLKIGSRVAFDDMPFILAQGANHLIGPKPNVTSVVAYGRGEIAEMKFHRFYLNEDYFIQAVVGADNALMEGELKLFRLERDWEPQGRDQWSVWLEGIDEKVAKQRGDVSQQLRREGWTDDQAIADEARTRVPDTGAIGYKTFTLPVSAKDPAPKAVYARMWPNADDPSEQVLPVIFEERIYNSPYDTVAKLLVRRTSMLYGRTLPDVGGARAPDEYLLLSESERGKETLVEAHVGLVIEDRNQMMVAA